MKKTLDVVAVIAGVVVVGIAVAVIDEIWQWDSVFRPDFLPSWQVAIIATVESVLILVFVAVAFIGIDFLCARLKKAQQKRRNHG